MSSASSVIAPLILTQALAAGMDRGFPGAAFLLASVPAFVSLGIIWLKVLGRVPAVLRKPPNDF